MIEVARKFFVLLLVLAPLACTQEPVPPLSSPPSGTKTGNAQQPAPERQNVTAPWGQQVVKSEANDPSGNSKTFLQQPTRLLIFERPSEAIPIWRGHSHTKPALVIISQTPFLGTVPETFQAEANQLVMTADSKLLQAKATNQTTNPMLLPQQSVSAALTAQFFSEVIWVLPHQEKNEISLELFRKQLVDSGTLWPEEAATLNDEGGIFRGQVRGYPFTACRIDRLPRIDKPCLLHLDLSYFAGRYENEIVTPIFPLVHETLQTLRQARLRPLDVTLSLGNREDGVPLDIRFLKNLLADILQKPALLDQPLPELLAMRKEARYLETFFQTDGILTIYKSMGQLAPEDPSIQYDLYRAYWTAKEYETALQHLDKAVRLDPGYGVEYLHLAVKQLDKRNFDGGLEFLQKIARQEPNNPLIALQLAEVYLDTGKKEKALALINRLSEEQWSAIYFKEIPGILQEMRKKAGD
jgi:hypothetical protein